jgi:hypothetical protein
MLRNKIISIVALATIGLASPTGAFARGGGGGHGGGGGFHGGEFGFRGGGFRGRGFGFFGPYAYGDYPYYYGDDYEGGCYLVARRVLTRYGWRSRRVEICD